MEKRKLSGVMQITQGNKQFVAIPASEVEKIQKALKEADARLTTKGKTCCDFCCDWCDFRIIAVL